VHKSATPEFLLKASEPALCFQCHTDVKPAFDMPFHHPVNEGVVKCSDCHDVHGTFGNNNLRSTPIRIWFAPSATPMCAVLSFTSTPRSRRRDAWLATRRTVRRTPAAEYAQRQHMCNQCHSPVAAGTVHGMNAGSAELLPCISCHTMIHGSNLNQAFLK